VTEPIKSVAVLGAGGTMGFGMTRNLAGAGFAVHAWNRSREKAEPLADDGATIFDTAVQAADGCDLLLTMLPDGETVMDVVSEVLAHDGRPPTWMQTSTIGEGATLQCAELAREHRVAFVDSPVLGTKQPAMEGELVVLASGPDELRERMNPVFDAIGKRTMWVGEAGEGSRLKLAANAWIGTVVEGGAEVLALAGALGLDPKLVLEAVSDGPLDLPYLQIKGKAMLERDFDASFKLALAAKDAGLALDAARHRGLELPVVESVHARLAQSAAEHGDKDVSATYLTLID
jgi:3-hydroxyisobutyrate dehydrogenase